MPHAEGLSAPARGHTNVAASALAAIPEPAAMYKGRGYYVLLVI